MPTLHPCKYPRNRPQILDALTPLAFRRPRADAQLRQCLDRRRLSEVVDEAGRFIDERPIGAIGDLGHTSHGFSPGRLLFFSRSLDGRLDDSMADLFKMATGDVEVGEAIGNNLALFGDL